MSSNQGFKDAKRIYRRTGLKDVIRWGVIINTPEIPKAYRRGVMQFRNACLRHDRGGL